jgi:hypothetical protein
MVNRKRALGSARIFSDSSGSRFDFIANRPRIAVGDEIQLEFLANARSERPAFYSVAPAGGTEIELDSNRNGSAAVEHWSVTVANSQPGKNRQDWQSQLRLFYWSALGLLCAASLLLGLMTALNRRRMHRAAGLVLLGAGLVLARGMFYSLIEVWLGWGLQRYVEPSHLLTVLIVIVSSFLIGAASRRILTGSRRGRAPALPSNELRNQAARAR